MRVRLINSHISTTTNTIPLPRHVQPMPTSLHNSPFVIFSYLKACSISAENEISVSNVLFYTNKNKNEAGHIPEEKVKRRRNEV